jgi:ectoine hydroxylase-related dioxygenase (phytanoyl-CoA dioxygenase family)
MRVLAELIPEDAAMLTDAQINQFHSKGYLVVPDLLPQTLIARITDEYQTRLGELLDEWGLGHLRDAPFETQLIEAYRTGHDWHQPLDISLPAERITEDTPMHFGPAVFDMVTCPAILDIVESLIGPEIVSNPIQHVRIKPPAAHVGDDEARAHITVTDWHQDRAVALESADETDMITVWLAINDATVENGCLQVIPFEDEVDMLPHCPKRQTTIADGFIDPAKALPLPVPAGGALLLHPLIPHSSLDNTTDGIRWSFDLRYNRIGQPTGRDHFPEFVARSKAAPETVLTNWQRWLHMWEEARTACAADTHIELHRWQSDAPACA